MGFEIFADGSSLGNPGPAGLGVVIYKNKTLIKKISLSLGEATNNIAEYAALLVALGEAISLKSAEKEKINIYMDSTLVVNQLKEKFKVKNQSLKPFFTIARHMRKLVPNCEILFRRREENRLADKIAKVAAKNVKGSFSSQLELLR